MGQRAASGAAAVDAVDDPEGALQAVIAAGFGEIFDVSKNPSVTAVQAAINAKGPGEVVRIGPGTVNMTAQLVIDGQDVWCDGTAFKVPTSVSATAVSRIVLLSGDHSGFHNAYLDGNRAAREAAGKLPTDQSGIQGLDALNVRHTRVSDVWVRDVGCRSDVEPQTRTFGAFSLQRTNTATEDVYGNDWRNIHLDDPDRQASFLMRMDTGFDAFVAGQQGHFMRDNRVSDGHLRGHRQERHRAGRAGHDLQPGRGHRHLRRGRGRGCGLRLRGAGEPAAASH